MGTSPCGDPPGIGIANGVGESSRGPPIGVSALHSKTELAPNWMVWLTPGGLEGESPNGDFPSRGGKVPPSGKVRASMVGGCVGASIARHGSVTEGSTPSTFAKVCVGSTSPPVSASTTGGVSTPTGPELSSVTALPPAREETRIEDIAERGGSPLRLARSARTGAEAHEGVISPGNSPIASTVVIGTMEASKAPRRTSKGQS